MPWEACKFDPIEGDVGCDGEPREIEDAELELHDVLKVSPPQILSVILSADARPIFGCLCLPSSCLLHSF
jgi:hypothetical protein